MGDIDVLSRTQKIIVDSSHSIRVVNAGPPGPPGEIGATGPPSETFTLSVEDESHIEVIHELNGYPEVQFLELLDLGDVAYVMVQPLFISVNEFHVDFIKARTGTLIWRL